MSETLLAGAVAAGGDTGPEVISLGEGRMVREDGWREVHRLFTWSGGRSGDRPDAGAGPQDRAALLQRGGAGSRTAGGQAADTLLAEHAHVSAGARAAGAVLGADSLPGAAPAAGLPRQLRDGEALRAAAAGRRAGRAERATRALRDAAGRSRARSTGARRACTSARQPVALHIFVLTLGFSRRSFYEPVPGETPRPVPRCPRAGVRVFRRPHARASLRSAAHRLPPGGDGRQVVWNATFKAFADYWGFEPRLCRPYRAQTKGKVESGVKYFKRNFLPGPDLRRRRGLPASSSASGQAEIADVRIHGTTHERPIDRFARERAHLIATAGQPELPPRGAASPASWPTTTW